MKRVGSRRSQWRRDYVKIADDYIKSVFSGERPAGRYERLACERYIRDLDRRRSPWVLDTDRATSACLAIEALPHVKGQWASRHEHLILRPWQVFAVVSAFGWVDKRTRRRRYRTAYMSVARKNGKTTLAAAIMLYMLGLDGEIGAEVYSAATTRDQASLAWSIARRMAQLSPDYRRVTGIRVGAFVLQSDVTGSRCMPLSADAHTLEGLSVHCCIIDELHAHRDRSVWDVVTTATGARQEPLIWAITTAGASRSGICWEVEQYARAVLDGHAEDDTFFGLIFQPDDEDDWLAESTWYKANPNLGVSIHVADIREQAMRARRVPSARPAFERYRLNRWVSQDEAWLNLAAWDACEQAVNWDSFRGAPCIIALDLASKRDIAAMVMVFQHDERFYVRPRFYLPAFALEQSPNAHLYMGWRDHFIISDGDVTDFGLIEQDILEAARTYTVRQVVYDPFQATQLATRLMERGLPLTEVGATIRNFSEPMKHLEALILRREIVHDGNPVMRWMMGNVSVKEDLKGNIFPRKASREHKIDGPVALIMAVNWALRDRTWAEAPADPEEVLRLWAS